MKIDKLKIKRISIISIFIIFITSSISYGNEIQRELSLEDAIRIGIENSSMIKMNEINIENKEMEYQQARTQERSFRRNMRKIDNIMSIPKPEGGITIPLPPNDYFPEGIEIPSEEQTEWEMMQQGASAAQMAITSEQQFLMEEEAASKSADLTLKEAKMKTDYIKMGLKSGITQAYYAVLQTRDAYEISQETLKNLQENYKLIEREYELGVSSKSDLYMAEMSLNEGKINLDKSKNTYREAMRMMNGLLDYPLDTELKLTSGYEKKDVDMNLERDIDYAFNNRYDYIVSKNTRDLLELQFNVTKRTTTPNTYVYKQAENNLISFTDLLKQDKKDIESEIRTKYDAVKAAEREIELMEINVKRAEEGLRLNKLAYELESSTYKQIDESIIQLNSAKLGRANAISKYNSLLIEYEQAVKLGNLS